MNRTGIGLLLVALAAGACTPVEEMPYISSVDSEEGYARQTFGDVAVLKEEMGIESELLTFRLREGTRLEAQFRAELDGQVVPELSPTFLVPASADRELSRGTISIVSFERRRGGGPAWRIDVSGDDGIQSHGYEASFPYYWVDGGLSGWTKGGGILEPGSPKEAWSLSKDGKTQTGQHHKLDYTLTVRVLDLEPGQPTDKVELRAYPRTAAKVTAP